MFHDPLIQKAWEVRDQAEQFPSEVLLEAAVWLEEKFHRTPRKEIAAALALQYFILALRRAQASPDTLTTYFSRAQYWQAEAERLPAAQRLLSGALTLN
ncbi:MAG: hypothetical protein AB7G75_03155 [Candidatus Binatia bacterium]